MTTQHISVTVNGEAREADVEPRLLLVHLLRDEFGLTGTHVGCDTSNCGACTVHLDGHSVKSCNVLAVQADGAEIATIEGLAQNGELHPMQKAFHEKFKLSFPLLADPDKKVSGAFGVPSRGNFAARQAFLIKEGKVVWRDLEASTAEQAADVLAAIEGLKAPAAAPAS